MPYRLVVTVAIVDTIEEANVILAGYDSDDQIPEIEWTEAEATHYSVADVVSRYDYDELM